MYYLPVIAIAFLGLIGLIVECNVINIHNGISDWNVHCSKYKRDIDVIRSFSFTVQLNPLITTGKTYAVMNAASQIEELVVYHEAFLSLDVFCLIHLRTLKVNGTPFASQFELDDNSISTGLSPLISRLNKLSVLSLINTTASYIPAQALAALTNITVLQVENCGLNEIPSTISLLTNIQQLRLSKNHLHSMPHSDALKKMSKLTYLDLSHNKIKDIIDVQDIPSRILTVIDFSYNQIDYVPPEISQFYYELYYLYLNDNKLSYVPTDIFRLVYLKKLDLQRNLLPADEVNAVKSKVRTAIPNCVINI